MDKEGSFEMNILLIILLVSIFVLFGRMMISEFYLVIINEDILL